MRSRRLPDDTSNASLPQKQVSLIIIYKPRSQQTLTFYIEIHLVELKWPVAAYAGYILITNRKPGIWRIPNILLANIRFHLVVKYNKWLFCTWNSTNFSWASRPMGFMCDTPRVYIKMIDMRVIFITDASGLSYSLGLVKLGFGLVNVCENYNNCSIYSYKHTLFQFLG